MQQSSLLLILISAFIVSNASFAIDVVTEATPLPAGTCQRFEFFRPVNVYKDPALFLPDLNLISVNPVLGWRQLMQENPVLTQMQGNVKMILLGPASEFKNFGAIARVYEAAEPRLHWTETQKDKKGKVVKNRVAQVIRIQICGNDAYNSTLGFVLEDDFKKAQQYQNQNASMPPSIYPNPVPEFPAPAVAR